MSNKTIDPEIDHSWFEDGQAIVTSTLMAALGVYLLQSAHVVTGGAAGLTLLMCQWLGWNFALAYPLVSIPFMALALWRRGLTFTLKSMLTVSLLSVFNFYLPRLVDLSSVTPWFGAVMGNLLLGVSMLIMFRHRTSLGGFNVIALIAQDKLGWKAGFVQMSLDALIVGGFAVANLSWSSLWAIIGVVVLNMVLATNHRPDRYIAG